MFTFRNNLFKTADGKSMVFNVERCRDADADELRELIEYGGGLVSDDIGPHTITLSNNKDATGPHDVFDALFIFKSCARNQILPLKPFRLNESSQFGDDFDPNDVLQQISSWRDAEQWSEDGVIEPLHYRQDSDYTGFIMIGDVVPLVVLRRLDIPPGQNSINLKQLNNQVPNESPAMITISSSSESIETCDEEVVVRKRNNYTQKEREKIVAHLVEHEAYHNLSHQSMWEKMSRKFPRHTWQSLKEHFRKRIMPYIWNYDVSEDIVEKFRSGISSLNHRKERRENDFDSTFSPSDSEDEEVICNRKRTRKTSEDKGRHKRRIVLEISSSDEESKHSNKCPLQQENQQTRASQSRDCETPLRKISSWKKFRGNLGLDTRNDDDDESTNNGGKSIAGRRKLVTKQDRNSSPVCKKTKDSFSDSSDSEDQKMHAVRETKQDRNASPVCKKKKGVFSDSSDSEEQNILALREPTANGEPSQRLESSGPSKPHKVLSTPSKKRLTRTKTSSSKENHALSIHESNNSSPNDSKQLGNFWSGESKTDSLIVEYSPGEVSEEFSAVMHSGFDKKSQSMAETHVNFDQDAEDFDPGNDNGLQQEDVLNKRGCRGLRGIRPLKALNPQSGSPSPVNATAAQSPLSSQGAISHTNGKKEVKDASTLWLCADPVLAEGCSQTDPVTIRPLLVLSSERQSLDGNSAPVTRQSSKENNNSPASSAPLTRQSSKDSALTSKSSSPGMTSTSTSPTLRKNDISAKKILVSEGCSSKPKAKPTSSKKIHSPSLSMDRSPSSSDRCTRQSQRKTRSKLSLKSSSGVGSPKYQNSRKRGTV